MTVTIGANVYTLVGRGWNSTNVSTAPNGLSGTLTLSGNVSTSDGTAGNTVMAANGVDHSPSLAPTNTSQILVSDTLIDVLPPGRGSQVCA